MALCHLCRDGVPDAELLDHLRRLHPGALGEGPEVWPDGMVVVYDTTLEPDDFGNDPKG